LQDDSEDFTDIGGDNDDEEIIDPSEMPDDWTED
jgi:hypothetical protein